MNERTLNDFENAAATAPRGGFVSDLWGLLASTKKWWLLPILIVSLLIGLMIMLSGSAAAPFLYTLF